MKFGASVVLTLLFLAAPARAATTLTCHLIAWRTFDFTMKVDADAQSVEISGDNLFDQVFPAILYGIYYPAGSKEVKGPDYYHEVDFGDRYIDLLLRADRSIGMRLDRQTLKLLPIGAYPPSRNPYVQSWGTWVAEGSGCQMRVI